MTDEKRLEQEYRKIKQQAAPDLWSRIEAGLKDHPERMTAEDTLQKENVAGTPADRQKEKEGFLGLTLSMSQVYKMAAAAAAMLVLAVTIPALTGKKGSKSVTMAPEADREYAAATVEMISGGEEAALETAADAGGGAEPMEGNENEAGAPAGMLEEGYGDEAGAPAGMPEEGYGDETGAPAGMPMEGNESKAEAPVWMAEESAKAGQRMAMSGGRNVLPEGVTDYRQLQLAAYQPVTVPENALTVPEDYQYFSEAVLKDTELLCGGTVTKVSLEEDSSGRAIKVVYEMTLDQVYYAEDYITGIERITVKSPIVKTDGDQAYILYQLQPGGTYLLPLIKQDGEWELLYPFAPQIQVTGDGAYLFHSGYASLVNDTTDVVIGSQEGENDYYYDRMVLRNDEDFLSQLVSLVEH